MKLFIYGIPEDELLAMREAADLAFRGIQQHPQTQVKRPFIERGSFSCQGRIVNEETPLTAFYARSTV